MDFQKKKEGKKIEILFEFNSKTVLCINFMFIAALSNINYQQLILPDGAFFQCMEMTNTYQYAKCQLKR